MIKEPNTERLKVIRSIHDEKLNTGEIKITKLIDHLKGVVEQYGKESMYVTEGWDSFSYIKYEELENDEEYSNRLLQEEKNYNKSLEKKRKQLEKLKKELGED